jgi:hypothetical protein
MSQVADSRCLHQGRSSLSLFLVLLAPTKWRLLMGFSLSLLLVLLAFSCLETLSLSKVPLLPVLLSPRKPSLALSCFTVSLTSLSLSLSLVCRSSHGAVPISYFSLSKHVTRRARMNLKSRHPFHLNPSLEPEASKACVYWRSIPLNLQLASLRFSAINWRLFALMTLSPIRLMQAFPRGALFNAQGSLPLVTRSYPAAVTTRDPSTEDDSTWTGGTMPLTEEWIVIPCVQLSKSSH